MTGVHIYSPAWEGLAFPGQKEIDQEQCSENRIYFCNFASAAGVNHSANRQCNEYLKILFEQGIKNERDDISYGLF